MKCSDCGSKDITEHEEIENFIYKGVTLKAKVEFSVCSHCNREFIRPEQISKNDAYASQARQKYDASKTTNDVPNTNAC